MFGENRDDSVKRATFPYSALKLGPILGQGSFGVVQRGQLDGTDVAIKKVKNTMESKELKAFEDEALLMLYVFIFIILFFNIIILIFNFLIILFIILFIIFIIINKYL